MIAFFFLTVFFFVRNEALVWSNDQRRLPLLTNNTRFECQDCRLGPIFLSQNFSVFEQQLDTIYIQAGGVLHNCVNLTQCDMIISVLLFQDQQLSCRIFQNEVYSSYKLNYINKYIRKIPRFSTFNAKWAYTIYWIGVGESQHYCQHQNSYQIVFTTDDKFNFIIFNYFSLNLIPTFNFSANIKSREQIRFLDKSIITLFSKSNIDEPGMWIYLVNKQDNIIQNEVTLIIFINVFVIYYYSN